MDRKYALIQHVADGAWHSGEDLATTLGVSRAAVWKRLKGLESCGLEFDSQAGKGYCLKEPIELLDEGRIRQQMRSGECQVEVLAETDSTNRHLADVSSERASPAICFAEYQTAGRGRRGRQWQSPFGANLYTSFLWRFEAMPADLPALSLAVGVITAEVLTDCGFRSVGLKWPNDLLSDGRKLGGILIEHRGEMGGPCQVIVGLGLNYNMQFQQAGDIDQPWVSIAQLAQEQAVVAPGRNKLAAKVTDGLVAGLSQFEAQGFEAFRTRWEQYDLAMGQQIRVEQAGGWQDAEALGVDRDGALIVRLRGERQRFMAGDISLRIGVSS